MLPEMPSTSKPEQKAMAGYDARKKEQMKSCADNRRGAKESCIKPGDTVLLKQPKENKFSAPYNPQPFVVEKKKGTMVTASLLRRGLHEVSSEGKGARKERWEELNKGSLCELMQSIWRRI